MGRELLCKLRAQTTFDSDGTAALKLRRSEAKIQTLTVAQEEEWQLCASRKEIPEMPKLPFKIPGVWTEDNPSRLAWNIPPVVVVKAGSHSCYPEAMLHSLQGPSWDPKASSQTPKVWILQPVSFPGTLHYCLSKNQGLKTLG
jgi:hypothetical protein